MARFFRKYIATFLVLVVAITCTSWFAQAKYVSTYNVTSALAVKITVNQGYTVDSEKLWTALATLQAENPTSISFVKGTEVPATATCIDAATSGIQTSSSQPVGIFKDGTNLYVAPMAKDSTSPASVSDAITANSYRALLDSDNSNITSFQSISLTNLDTTDATDMGAMFSNNSNLTSLTLGDNFDTSSVETMDSMFSDCKKITTLTFGDKFSTSSVTNMDSMFSNCEALSNLDVSKFDTAKVTTMKSTFANCKAIASLNLSNFDTSSVTDMSGMFQSCSALATLNLSSFNTSSVTTAKDMFNSCSVLETVTLGKDFAFVGTDGYLPAQNSSDIAKADGKWYDTADTTVTGYTPEQLAGITRTQTCTYTSAKPQIYITLDSQKFYDAFSANIDDSIASLSFVNKSDVPSSASRIDTGGLQVDGSARTIGMYYNSTTTEMYIAPADDDTAIIRPANCDHLFSPDYVDCYMLSGVRSLTFSNFDTSQIDDMNNMFNNMFCLETLDISSFDTEKVYEMGYMFTYCSALKTIYVSDSFSTDLVQRYDTGYYMFLECTSLVGGAGTAYDENNIEAGYAHVDGGTSNPGYFTLKNG